MRLADLSVRHRVAVLAAVPLTASILLTTPLVVSRVQSAQQANRSATTLSTARQVGQLVEDIQHERLLSIAYLSNDKAPVNPVVLQSAKVDSDASDVLNSLGGNLPADLKKALDGLSRLRDYRARVLARTVAAGELKTVYAASISSLIDGLGLTGSSEDGGGTAEARDQRTLDSLLRLDEDDSELGASLFTVVSDPQQVRTSISEAESQLAVALADSDKLSRSATASQAALLVASRGSRQQQAISAVNALRVLSYSATGGRGDQALANLGFTPPTILDDSDAQGTLRQIAQEKISRDAAARAESDAQSATSTAALFTLATLGLSGVMILFAVSLSRSISLPLVRLRGAAQSVAELSESELARVTEDGTEEADPVRLTRIEVTGQDEVGQLAAAFNRVQEASVALVERQIVSRRNAAAMFGNVGRRTQNLAGRQLALIDELEREEVDPGTLERLYRLDHVSTRLRRHADSLVVLSGWSEPVVSSSPVPLGDLLRSALGTIEEFQRVELGGQPPVLVSPGVAGDLVLVLAELLENATSFSPPTSMVVVGVAQTAEGCVVRIVDHGVGMPTDRLAVENARLADPAERLDLASTEVLGLFVVGRLCRRHGLRVQLSSTSGGGTTASVSLPWTHLRSASPVLSAAALVPAPHPRGESSELAPVLSLVPPPQEEQPVRGPLATGPVPARPAAIGPGGLPQRTKDVGHSGEFSWFRREIESEIRKVLDRRTAQSAQSPAVSRAPVPTGAPAVSVVPDPRAAPGTGPTPAGLVRRVPGAQLPTGVSAPQRGVLARGFRDLDPDAARAMIEDFDAGIRRAINDASTRGF